MEITYVIIIAIVTYVLGSITKLFIEVIPNKYIPLQNVVIGVVSALICYFTKIETDLLQAIVLCLTATMGAGGVADLMKTITKKGE
jgi:hypothetical protein